MAKQTIVKSDAKYKIINSAEQLMIARGIGGTSLADIASFANFSKGTLYYYYPSKEKLILDIADLHIKRLTDMLYFWVRSINKEWDAGNAIKQLIIAFTENEDALKLHIMLNCEAVSGNEPLRAKLNAAYREWEVLLDVGFLKLPVCARLRSAPNLFLTMLGGLCVDVLIGMEPDAGQAAAYAVE
ncbi:MAG: DNA-binding transcriptional repressor AcrR [Firmicutes bacterium ADurb.Bin182]|nr:MAG: DNA-binding transcriptional repressor AcrR [Firmicutes bacterium ADurb.Bin182]